MSHAPLPPGLYVAATPIGNLGDVTDRLRHALRAATYVYCEDTRVTGRLLAALGVDRGLRTYHEHNAAAARPGVLTALADGASVVLVSDAGTPLISDPGYKLVREVRAAGHIIAAIPGPSALTTALSIAGAATDTFTFAGFLPAKTAGRRTRLEALASRSDTLVFYETGPRLAATLADLAEVIGPDTVIIARELTKRYEEVVEGPPASLATTYAAAAPKGEIVLIVPARAPAATEAIGEADVDRLMEKLREGMSLKDASEEVAAAFGLKKREVYQRWLDRTR